MNIYQVRYYSTNDFYLKWYDAIIVADNEDDAKRYTLTKWNRLDKNDLAVTLVGVAVCPAYAGCILAQDSLYE